MRAAIAILMLALAAPAQQKPATPAAQPPAQAQTPRAKYDGLVQRLRSGDQTVDLNELRMAAGEAGVESDPGARDRLFDAANHEDYKKMEEAATQVLASNYADLDGHFFAKQAARELGRPEQVDFHDWVLRGLIASLRSSGDGETPETAVHVISVDEEYFILHMLNQEPKQQALGTCAGHPCDVMTTSDNETHEERKLYFDVSIPMARMQKALGEKKK